MKNAFKTILFLAVGFGLFFCFQGILTPKWWLSDINLAASDAMNEYKTLDGDTDVQVIFVGASHVEFSIDPMAIYEQSGIVTYNFASYSQPTDVSYYLLKEALETQKPQYIFLDPSPLFFRSFSELAYRYYLDFLPLSSNKIELARAYADNFPQDERLEMFLSAIIPFFEYHDRWSELLSADFESVGGRNLYRKGYYLSSYMKKAIVDVEVMNEIAEINHTDVGWTRSFQNGTESVRVNTARIYDPQVSESSLEYLLRIQELCEANEAELILLKPPSLSAPQQYESAWTEIRSEIIQELSQRLGLQFIDMMYDFGVEPDWSTDSIDGGKHMNYAGARKVSAFLADYLQNVCGLTGGYSRTFEDDLPLYHAVCRAAALETTWELADYLDALSQRDGLTVFLSVSDDMMENLTDYDRECLGAYGLRTDFDALSYSDAFLAVVENGEVIYEAVSNRALSWEGSLENGAKYSISSCGWYIGEETEIVIDDVNYSQDGRGLNIVVYDNGAGCVIDSLYFDTHFEEEPQAARDAAQIEVLLREYETVLMKEDYAKGIR